MVGHISKVPDWILHCAINGIIIAMALCVSLPLGSVSKTFGFGSSCLLFANVTVNIKDNTSVFIDYKRTSWGDIHYCYYTTFLPIVVAIHGFIWSWFFINLKRTMTEGELAGLLTAVIAFLNFVLFVCMFVSSCFVSRGFYWWCRELSFNLGTSKSFRASCEHIDELQWKPSSRKYSLHFYMTFAEASGWLMTLLLGCQVVFILHRGYKNIVYSSDDKSGINNAMYGPYTDNEINTETGSVCFSNESVEAAVDSPEKNNGVSNNCFENIEESQSSSKNIIV